MFDFVRSDVKKINIMRGLYVMGFLGIINATMLKMSIVNFITLLDDWYELVYYIRVRLPEKSENSTIFRLRPDMT